MKILGYFGDLTHETGQLWRCLFFNKRCSKGLSLLSKWGYLAKSRLVENALEKSSLIYFTFNYFIPNKVYIKSYL